MKNTIKLSAIAFAAVSGLLISNHVLASEVTKDGTEITVTEPTVEVQKQGDSFYDKVDVTVKTDIPDDVEINQGDTLTMPLPQELELETNYEFPVTNNSANELPKTGETGNVFLSIFGISLLISGAMIWNDNKKK